MVAFVLKHHILSKFLTAGQPAADLGLSVACSAGGNWDPDPTWPSCPHLEPVYVDAATTLPMFIGGQSCGSTQEIQIKTFSEVEGIDLSGMSCVSINP